MLVADFGGPRALEPVIADIPPLDSRAAFADLAQLKLDDADLPAVLARVADLARRALPLQEAVIEQAKGILIAQQH